MPKKLSNKIIDKTIVPAMIKVEKLARMNETTLRIPSFLSDKIGVGEEALCQYEETEDQKIIQYVFDKVDE